MADRVHMTRRSFDTLTEELRRLKSHERLQVAEDIRIARAHGDISENAEFEAAKERQAQLEARISLVEDRIARAEVVDTSHLPLDRVRFGLTVVLADLESGEEVTYTLIGEDESDISRGYLSVTSPVGRALIGKEVDDEVTVHVPAGTRIFEVREIRRVE